MSLHPDQRTKLDDSDDGLFYSMPRFVTHVDDAFLQTLTQLYRDRLPDDGHILDLMSSWVSHLPGEMQFAHVEGHGLNAAELARNPRLDHYIVQNLNQDLQLPFADGQFDAVINAVSVQYLQYPEAIFCEIYRILKPGGIAIVSFSNRMFFQKAIQAWRDNSESDRLRLVHSYFQKSGFAAIEAIAPDRSWLSILNPRDPFYAVLGHRPLS